MLIQTNWRGTAPRTAALISLIWIRGSWSVFETWALPKVRDIGRPFVKWQSKLHSRSMALQADYR